MPATQNAYRSLKAEHIVATIARLERRIAERFPTAGLRQVAAELLQISREAMVRAELIRRPHFLLRALAVLIAASLIAGVGWLIHQLRLSDDLFRLEEFAQAFEAGLGSLAFLGAAIAFFFTLELRVKRRRALTALHELRAIAHIIDMHQLTKDPESLAGRQPTASSPPRTMTTFELGRYLDYCGEMLSLVSKLGALYVQDFPDAVALEAVDDLAALTNGLTSSIWQKIMVLDTVGSGAVAALAGPAQGSPVPVATKVPSSVPGPAE